MSNLNTTGGELLIDFGSRLAEAGIDMNGTGADPATRTIAMQTVLDMAIGYSVDLLDLGGREPDAVSEDIMGAYLDFTARPAGILREAVSLRLRSAPLSGHPAVQVAGSLAMEGLEYVDLPEVTGEALIALGVADHRGVLPHVI